MKTFEKEMAEAGDQILPAESRITVMKYEVGRPAFKKVIENTLEAMQHEVGGYIEVAPHDQLPGLFFVLNGEGKMEGRQRNIEIYKGRDYIAGDFFICRISGEDMASINGNDEFQLQLIDRYGTKWTGRRIFDEDSAE